MDTEHDEQNNKDKQDDKRRKKRKPYVENESVNVDQEEDEVIILKKNKITHVSL